MLKIKFSRILTSRNFSKILRWLTEIDIVRKRIAGVKHRNFTSLSRLLIRLLISLLLIRISSSSIIWHFSEWRRSELSFVIHSEFLLILQATARSLDIFSDHLSGVAVIFPRIYSVDGLLHCHHFLHVVVFLRLLISSVSRILRLRRLRPVSHHELLSVALFDLCLLLVDIEVGIRVVNSLPLLLSLLVLNEHLFCQLPVWWNWADLTVVLVSGWLEVLITILSHLGKVALIVLCSLRFFEIKVSDHSLRNLRYFNDNLFN